MQMLTATGPWMYPLLGLGLCLLLSMGRAALLVGRADGMPAAGPPHHAVLAWGVLGLVVGLLGTVIGFGRLAIGARAASGAERADLEAMLAVMWDGALIIVTPVTLGLWLFTAALAAWLVLQYALELKVG